MKRKAITWIIAASAVIFLISGTAWADGKGDRGRHKSGQGNGYHSAPHHNGGQGTKGYQKRPPLGKHHGDRLHRGPQHRKPYQGHYRPHNGNTHRRPHYGHGINRPHHHRPHHDGHRGRVVGVVKGRDVRSSVALSFLTGNPLFALDAIINHR